MRLRALAVAAATAASLLSLAAPADATCTPAGVPTCDTVRRVRQLVCEAFVNPPC